MYAVIQTGGRQFKVTEGDTIRINAGAVEVGSTLTFDQVLLTGGDDTKVGTPTVDGAVVTGEVTATGRGPKVLIFKKRRRQDSKVTRGFRDHFASVRIDSIKA